MEGRLPAASRIPHAADGLVRAAAVADPGGGRGRQDGHRRRHARRPLAAHSAALSRQPADGGRRGPGGARPGAHARHARIHARQDGRWRDRRCHHGTRRDEHAADRGHVPDHGDRQLRGPLRDPDGPSRARRRRLPAPRRLRLQLRQRVLVRRRRRQSVLRRQAARQEPDGGRVMKTLRALAALLSYPTADLIAAAGEIRQAIDSDAVVARAERVALHRLIDDLAGGDLYDLQERYGLLFDRTRSLSLHLFEHVHGESRDRGQAMIDLKTQYENANLFMSAAELPDFVPLFLEYLSLLPASEACETLGQPAHIFAALAERLRKRGSAYEAVFRALVALAAVKPKADLVSALLAEP